jgi:hypothetical protein
MPQLTEFEYNDILKNFELDSNFFEVFVETGTHYGQTIQNIKHKFQEIHSIELSIELYNKCKELFQNEINVFLYQGDSAFKLPEIIKKVKDNAVFWLDGHYSGGGTARGTKDCPLIEEIDSINIFFKKKCLIIIDDIRLFGTYLNEDWSKIDENEIDSIVKNRIQSKIKIKDRLIYFLKE